MLLALALAPAAARAGGDQGAAAAIGLAGGGGWTPGGFHADGSYLLSLDARDWFDLGLALTLGGGGAACYAQDGGGYACRHGLTDGEALGFRAGVRHYFLDGDVQPFARAGAGVDVVRFPDDVIVTSTGGGAMAMPMKGMYGIAISAHAGGGVRVPVAPDVALVGAFDVYAGLGGFAGTADGQRLLGFSITAGAEWRP
jgi:hypothetical protein